MLQHVGNINQVTVQANNANASGIIPACYAILGISMVNTTNNAVTGNINIGTTAGASDIVSGQVLAARDMAMLHDSAILKKMLPNGGIFANHWDQPVYISSSNWNSANVIVRFYLVRAVDQPPNF